jgi:hypothetical protein
MHYKISVDNIYPAEAIVQFWDTLYKIIQTNENIDSEKNRGSFSDEKNFLTFIDGYWGATRPESEDMIELSAVYPDVLFTFTQATNILNGYHFEDLKNYHASQFLGGKMVRTLAPKPMEWVIVDEFIDPFEDLWDED